MFAAWALAWVVDAAFGCGFGCIWMVILVGFVGWVDLVCISDFGRERF